MTENTAGLSAAFPRRSPYDGIQTDRYLTHRD